RKQRTGRALNAGVARAKSRLAESPEDGGRALAVAEALGGWSKHTGHGDLSEAIALARGATRSSALPANLRGEAMFWEGKAQALLGRHDRARPLLQSALETLPASKKGTSLRKEADWYLGLQKPESD